jgi:putative colanic acid biosynthesis acetyltransferase WcaF
VADSAGLDRPPYPSLRNPHPEGYDKGRGFLWQASWFAVQNLVFGAWWCPGALRPKLLKFFGASIGENAFIRHRVRVLWPWKLTIGDNTLIGEDVWLLNLEQITIGSDVCLSQGAFLCTGSHDHRSPDFRYDNGPIEIRDGGWVAAQALILRGVTVGIGCVVGARAVVRHDVPDGENVGVNAVH